MNNKLYTALFLALGIGFASSSAYATEVVLGTAITEDECEVLDEDVSPSLSKNVHAAYSCDADFNLIQVASCHEAGRKKIEKITCSIVGEWGGETYWNSGTTTCTDNVETTAAGKGFLGSNAGGSVAGAALDGACDASEAEGLLIAGGNP